MPTQATGRATQPRGWTNLVSIMAVGLCLYQAPSAPGHGPSDRKVKVHGVKPDDLHPASPAAKPTAPRGQIKVTILSADSHKPAPAMVRLASKADGAEFKPSKVIEIGPQFGAEGDTSSNRKANLPGRLGGRWWCVPEPFDMDLAPGQYELAIRRGVEHVPVYDSITIGADELIEKTYEPKRWVDMRKLGWYSGDDHVHCRIQNDEDANRLMAWAQAEDIHVTNVLKMGDFCRTFFEQRGFGPQHRVIDGDYVIVPGQEGPRTHEQLGHTISLNIRSMVRDVNKYYLYDWVADTVHAQGGLWGYAHVNTGHFMVARDMSINIPKEKCDFVELLQLNQLGTGLYYDFLNLGFKVTASAGSDVPWGGTVGEVRLYAHVGAQPFSADAWFEAVKNGATFVTSGPMVEFRVNDVLPGGEIRLQQNRKLRVTARTWGDPQRSIPALLEIVRNGLVIQSVESPGPKVKELQLDFELDTGNGFWIAARVRAKDGTTAHTTPVYVVRDGLRFWKFDAVDELIAKRMTSLDQVEQIIAEAQQKKEAGEIENDVVLHQLTAQGEQLRARIDAARKFYNDLKQIAKLEAVLRANHESHAM